MGVEVLSRIQFAFTITFHYIYPPLSIGLSIALIFMEVFYLKTGKKIWEQLTRFWVKVFSMTFALGVATGIPMMFSLGTNWAKYARFVSDVSGSIIGAEGFLSFLVEAGFLGVVLFGWRKVRPKLHFFATVMVAIGAHSSAIWIVSFNSWMHAPSGYRLTSTADGTTVAEVLNWSAVFFSPLNMSHIVHVLLGAWMTGAFLILSVSAYYLLKKRHSEFAKKSFRIGIWMGILTAILQLVSSDHLARKVAVHNPEKFAAFEGVYHTHETTPAYLVGWVNTQEKRVYGIPLPGLLSFMTHRNFTTPVPGLDQLQDEDKPLVNAVFQCYHVMVVMWVLMFVAVLLGLYYYWNKQWNFPSWYLKFLIFSAVFPHLANIGGWYSACMGRQPWVVYQLLKTSEGYSPVISKGQVIASLSMFVVMYLMFLALFLFLLVRKIQAGPADEPPELVCRDVYNG